MAEEKGFSRRTFVKGTAAALTASLVANPSFGGSGGAMQEATANNREQVPHRPLGKTGVQVSALGVGGYHLGSIKEQDESNELVARALDAGINFFDNCWEYHDGLSEELLGAALKSKRDQAFVMNEGVHARANQTSSDAAARRVFATAADRPHRPLADS